MTREVEAIFENGVLRPVEPLPLAENQRVKVKISDLPEPVEHPNARKAELVWIGANGHLYKGEWVALQEYDLISHGLDADAVLAEARSKGVEHPLMFHVPEYFGEYSIGFL